MKKVVLGVLSTALLVSTVNAGGKGVEPAESISIPVIEEKSDSSFYAGAAFSLGKLNTFIYDKNSVGSAMVYGGYNLMSNLDTELRLHIGVKEGDELEHNYSLIGYLKPFYELSKGIKAYGLLGYGQTKVTYIGSFPTTDKTTIQRGLSYGIGVSYGFSSNTSFFIDATSLVDESETTNLGSYAVKLQTVNLGVYYSF
jgi:opacity protein-like surface antigen